MLEDERILLLNELSIIDKVFLSIDKDKTVSKEHLKKSSKNFLIN